MKRLLPFLFIVLLASCSNITKKATSTAVETLKEQSRISGVEFGEPQIVFENDSICLLKINAANGKENTDIEYMMAEQGGVTYEAFWDVSERGNVKLPTSDSKQMVDDFILRMAANIGNNIREVGSGSVMYSINFLGTCGTWKKCTKDELGEPLKNPYIYTECDGVCKSEKYGNYVVKCKLVIDSDECVSMQVYRNGRIDSNFWPRPKGARVKTLKGLKNFDFIDLYKRLYIFYETEESPQIFCHPEYIFEDEFSVVMSVNCFDGTYVFELTPYGYRNALKYIEQ